VSALRLRLAFVAAAVAVSLSPGVARAQEEAEQLGVRRRTFESPQHFAFELRFLPYRPNVDSDPNLHGATPYATAFGTSRNVMVQAEFDWQITRISHLGTVGPGVAIGYLKKSGDATFVTPHNGSTQSGETTSLELFPMYAVAVLRADVFWRELHIPLVPYAKAGLGLAFWRASNTLGTSKFQGVSGEGKTWGTQFALGIMLNLNPFDDYAAKNFDEAMGVNGTYVFAELLRSDLTGLGVQSGALRVGDSTWAAGLAMEF
jgi:hypothetical protein